MILSVVKWPERYLWNTKELERDCYETPRKNIASIEFENIVAEEVEVV